MATAPRSISMWNIMGRFFRLWLLCIVVCLSACQEGGDAGDLLGQWRMVGSDFQYVSFAGSVSLFRQINKNGEIYGNFQHVGDSLFIQCVSVKGEKKDTVIVEDLFGFKPFCDIRVRIETLDHESLILSKDGKVWAFCKY